MVKKLKLMSNGKLIYLNGASSSGKTTIAKDLQLILEDTFLSISSDTFSGFYPPKKKELNNYNQNYLSKVKKSLENKKKPSIVHLYNSFILSMINEGMNVIADTTFLKYMTIEEIKSIASIEAYLIDVICNIEVLEKREQLREDRPIGAARKHIEFCYDYQIHDCTVDTSETDSFTCAQVIKKVIGESKPKAFKKIIGHYEHELTFSLFENWMKTKKS